MFIHWLINHFQDDADVESFSQPEDREVISSNNQPVNASQPLNHEHFSSVQTVGATAVRWPTEFPCSSTAAVPEQDMMLKRVVSPSNESPVASGSYPESWDIGAVAKPGYSSDSKEYKLDSIEPHNRLNHNEDLDNGDIDANSLNGMMELSLPVHDLAEADQSHDLTDGAEWENDAVEGLSDITSNRRVSENCNPPSRLAGAIANVPHEQGLDEVPTKLQNPSDLSLTLPEGHHQKSSCHNSSVSNVKSSENYAFKCSTTNNDSSCIHINGDINHSSDQMQHSTESGQNSESLQDETLVCSAISPEEGESGKGIYFWNTKLILFTVQIKELHDLPKKHNYLQHKVEDL